jgi:hypothetical protein
MPIYFTEFAMSDDKTGSVSTFRSLSLNEVIISFVLSFILFFLLQKQKKETTTSNKYKIDSYLILSLLTYMYLNPGTRCTITRRKGIGRKKKKKRKSGKLYTQKIETKKRKRGFVTCVINP